MKQPTAAAHTSIYQAIRRAQAGTVPYAKIPREKFQQFGRGLWPISGKAFDFLLAISPFVDHDRRITISMEAVRHHLNMQRAAFDRILAELIEEGSLVQRDGHYYSLFHTLGTGTDESYVKLYAPLLSGTFQNWSLNKKRFFVHLFVCAGRQHFFDVPLEQLFRNAYSTTTTKKQAASYMRTLKEVAGFMGELVERGFLQIQLLMDDPNAAYPAGKRQVVSHTLAEKTDRDTVQKAIMQHYGCAEGRRVCSTAPSKHVIRVQLNKSVFSQQTHIPVQASEQEILSLCEQRGIGTSLLKPKMLSTMISLKKDLFLRLGEAGLALYREALQQFISEKADDVLYFNMADSLTNMFADFYLMPLVRSVLARAGAQQLQEEESGWTLEQTAALIGFFRERASHNEIILLDADLEQKTASIDTVDGYYQELGYMHDEWHLLYLYTQSIYKANADAFTDTLTRAEWKMYMREWAVEGILMVKERYEAAVQSLRSALHAVKEFLHKRMPLTVQPLHAGSVVTTSPYAVPFYNWLDDEPLD